MEEKTQNPNVEPAKEMTEAELSELLQIRRDKLKALQDAGLQHRHNLGLRFL